MGLEPGDALCFPRRAWWCVSLCLKCCRLKQGLLEIWRDKWDCSCLPFGWLVGSRVLNLFFLTLKSACVLCGIHLLMAHPIVMILAFSEENTLFCISLEIFYNIFSSPTNSPFTATKSQLVPWYFLHLPAICLP